MRNIHKNPLFYLSVILVIAAGLTVFDFVGAYQDPASAPLNGDVAAPVDKSEAEQIKWNGSLRIEGADGISASRKTRTPWLSMISDIDSGVGQDIFVGKSGIGLKESVDSTSANYKKHWNEIVGVRDWSRLDRVVVFDLECAGNCGDRDVDFDIANSWVLLTKNYSELDLDVEVKPYDDQQGSWTGHWWGVYIAETTFAEDSIGSDNIISAQLIRDGDRDDFNMDTSVVKGTYSNRAVEFGISDDASLNDLKEGDKVRFVAVWPPVAADVPPAITPAAPTNLDGTMGPDWGIIDLTWNDVDNNETRFQLERQKQSCFIACWWGSWSTIKENIPENAEEYTDNTVEAGKEDYYRYRLKACNGTSLCSDWVHTYVGD